jgi:uncharacterized protein YpmS
MTKKNYRLLFTLSAIFILVGFACKLPTVSKSVVTERVPVSSEAVQSLEENLSQALQDAKNGSQVSLVITEAELTSVVAFEVQSIDEPKISDVQIHLRNGQIEMYFNVQQSGITLPGEVIVSVNSDSQGKVNSNVESAKIGPLPLPDDMKSMISEQVNNAVQDQIHTNQGTVFVDSIAIENGQIFIQGHII